MGGVFLAVHHPLWPWGAGSILLISVLSAALRSGWWLAILPASLPFLNLSPWTGWHVFEEFDILVLGFLAGAYIRQARHHYKDRGYITRRIEPVGGAFEALLTWLRAGMLCSLALSLIVGVQDAGGWQFDWFAGYLEPLNSVRIFKASALSFLFIPLIRQEITDNYQSARRLLSAGILMGLTGSVLVLLWERIAFPGLLDFSAPYRTVALFWEMHLGGAAIDAYLVLTAPFVLWVFVAARRPAQWIGAAALLILCVYAWLTTFSRGVYVAIAVPLLLLALELNAGWMRKKSLYSNAAPAAAWRRTADITLLLVVLAEIVAVMVGSAFLRERMSDADRDWGGRVRHWEQGIGLLNDPADWLLGKGLGRFPANYGKYSSEDEFSGALQWVAADVSSPRPYLQLQGPPSRQELAGRFRLTQRLGRLSKGRHSVSILVRASTQTDVQVSLCEKHLLYEADCQRVTIQTAADAERWQSISAPLAGRELGKTPWYAPRYGELSISVANAGGSIDLGRIQVDGLCAECGLKNADFSDSTSHWFYSGRSYFLPWHIDNVYLEVLIEQGLFGLLLFCMLICTSLYCLVVLPARFSALSPYVAIALIAASLLGLVSSFMDMPRVALLFWLLLHFGHESRRRVR